MRKINFQTKSEDETISIGLKIGASLKGNELILLDGDLGAGKTHLTTGILRALKLSEYATSPTFTILNEYEGTPSLFHFDIYRLGSLDELLDIGFDEFISRGIVVVEWANIIPELRTLKLPKIQINITRHDDIGPQVRTIEIETDIDYIFPEVK